MSCKEVRFIFTVLPVFSVCMSLMTLISSCQHFVTLYTNKSNKFFFLHVPIFLNQKSKKDF